MNLHAARSRWRITRSDFIQSQNLSCRVIQAVVIELERGKCREETEFDIRCPRGKLDSRHGQKRERSTSARLVDAERLYLRLDETAGSRPGKRHQRWSQGHASRCLRYPSGTSTDRMTKVGEVSRYLPNLAIFSLVWDIGRVAPTTRRCASLQRRLAVFLLTLNDVSFKRWEAGVGYTLQTSRTMLIGLCGGIAYIQFPAEHLVDFFLNRHLLWQTVGG